MTLLTRRGLIAGLAGAAARPPKKRKCPVGMQPDQQGVFFQLVIQGGGTFTYDASGNLRSAEVGQTTTDPIQGITCYAGFSTFNGHGAVISLNSSVLDAFLFYADTGSSTQGALIASDSSAANVDPFANHFVAGRANYGAASSVVQLNTAQLSIFVPSDFAPASIAGGNGLLSLDSGQHVSTTDMFMQFFSAAASPNGVAQLVLAPGTASAVTTALVEVQGSESVSASAAAGDVLTVTNTHGAPTSPSMQITAQSSGDLALGIEVTGDADERLVIRSNGEIDWSSGAAAADVKLNRSGAGVLSLTVSDFNIGTVGRGLQVKTGANAKVGTAALVGGTISVPNTSVTANSIILLGQRTPGGTPGALFVSAVVVGTSFTIKSTSATDTSTVGYLIVETT